MKENIGRNVNVSMGDFNASLKYSIFRQVENHKDICYHTAAPYCKSPYFSNSVKIFEVCSLRNVRSDEKNLKNFDVSLTISYILVSIILS